MCGIFGYTGSNNCLPILLEGLKMLEYRGYDSAGIAFIEKNKLRAIKSCGKLSNLETRMRALELGAAHCGIGHTRWATHGVPSDVNAHPHCTDTLAIVHNGIIENHMELEAMLKVKGYTFTSETDTERAAKLIDMFYKLGYTPIATLFKVSEIIKGSYAFAVVFEDFPDKIFAIRKESPLIISKDHSGTFIASDIPAILPYSKEYCRLDENTVAELSSEKIKFYDSSLSEIEQEFETTVWDAEQSKKGGFPHFMLKEIYEEPFILEKTIAQRLFSGLPCFGNSFIDGSLLNNVEDIYIVACGTAMHAGLIGKYIIEKLAGVPVNVEIASEFRYREPILRKNSLVILLSQSGETADTLAALKYAKSAGIPTLAIVNVFGSSLAREADFVIYTMAGPEISVASTKAYSVQCAMLYLFAIHFSLVKNNISEEIVKNMCNRMSDELPRAVAATLALNDAIRKIAVKISSSEHLFYIGRGIDYYLCIEASLKLKEISYIHSEAYAAGELKHGTISLVSDGTPVICIMTDERLAKKTISGIHEVLSRGAHVTVICSENISAGYRLPLEVETLVLPESDPLLSPFLVATAVQLLAYHASAHKGLDVDKPRNLAKSVTVE